MMSDACWKENENLKCAGSTLVNCAIVNNEVDNLPLDLFIIKSWQLTGKLMEMKMVMLVN